MYSVKVITNKFYYLLVSNTFSLQVFDTLPAELFGPHDVPIDIIVTPTQVSSKHSRTDKKKLRKQKKSRKNIDKLFIKLYELHQYTLVF